MPSLTRIRVVPLPHQVEGIKKIEANGRATLLADEQGLGKTLQTLGVLYRNQSWKPAVIVCPANVKYNWEHEALMFFGMRASVCEGMKPPAFNRTEFNLHPQIIIINYDILKGWKDYLIKMGFSTLVFDECQYLCNYSSKRTKIALELGKHADHVIGLSGTPLQNKIIEFFPILKILWPSEFTTLTSFSDKYSYKRMTPWGWDYYGSKNIRELNKRLLDLGMIRRRKDVLTLPPKESKITLVEMTDPDEYQFASRDFLGWLAKTAAHKVRAAKKSEKMLRVGYLLRLVAKKKLKAVCHKANQFLMNNPKKKLVLMGVHQKAIRVLEEKIPFKSITIDGNVSGRMRQAAIDQFQYDLETRVCIGNVKAAGVGITLTAASDLWFFEFWFNPAVHNQAADRVHRIGQRYPVLIEYLVARGTIEEDICRLLQERQKIITGALDGGASDDNKEFNLYEELFEVLSTKLL